MSHRLVVIGAITGAVLIGIAPAAAAVPARVIVRPDPVAPDHRVSVATDACAPGSAHARAYSHAFHTMPLRPVGGGKLVAGTGRIGAAVGAGTYRVVVSCDPGAGPARGATGSVTVGHGVPRSTLDPNNDQS